MKSETGIGGVDFHCHLDLYPDHELAIRRAEAARVYTLAVTTTPRAWPRNYELTRHTRFVRAALGIHPQLAAEREGELSEWECYLPQTRYIGEVGLDASPRFYKSLDVQMRVFRIVLERCAEAGGKILSVHSVRSAPIVLDYVERHLPLDRGIVVLHWFTGSRRDAERALELGCYFSVNAQMLRSDRGRALVASLPMERILTESDGPFTSIEGRAAEPKDAHVASEAIARCRDQPLEVVTAAIEENLGRLLR